MKIVEVTGIAGVGKSYVINLLAKEENFIFANEIIKQYKLNDFKLLIYFFKNKNSFHILNVIIKLAQLLNIPLFHKINFIRNSIKKFGKNHFITSYLEEDDNVTIIIDEGISHLYQNVVSHTKQDNKKIRELVDTLIEYSKIEHQVVIITAENNIVFERLHSRGHRRITSETEITHFIEMGKENIKALNKKFYKTIQIENNQTDNLEFELNKIIGK